jgi:hypothetical protein
MGGSQRLTVELDSQLSGTPFNQVPTTYVVSLQVGGDLSLCHISVRE